MHVVTCMSPRMYIETKLRYHSMLINIVSWYVGSKARTCRQGRSLWQCAHCLRYLTLSAIDKFITGYLSRFFFNTFIYPQKQL